MARFYAIKCIVGEKSSEIQGKTVEEIIEALASKHGSEFKKAVFDEKTGKVRSVYNIFVNGIPINIITELKKKVKKGDLIAVVPVAAGG